MTVPMPPSAAEAPAAAWVADRWYSEKRLGGLSRFAFAITALNVLGHCFLGFEQSWLTPIVALAATYTTELVGEYFEARTNGRKPRFIGSAIDLIKFLLPAHISGLAIGMLIYAAHNLAAVAFAASVAMASKYLFRVPLQSMVDRRTTWRHFLNPSNFGITITLLLFPTVGISPPYQFSENTSGLADWLLPIVIICSGTYLNTKATGRIPLILAWLVAFCAQAVARSLLHGTPMGTGLVPMTGFAFILFTFYMVTDPATTPSSMRGQIAFGSAVAVGYAFFMELHLVFGLFYSLTAVTAGRGLWIAASVWNRSAHRAAPGRPNNSQLAPAE